MSDNKLDKFLDIGVMLKRRRLELNIELSDIAEKIKIPEQYIIDIENGNIENLIEKIYYEGCVIKYAKILNIKHDKLLEYIDIDISQLNNQKITFMLNKRNIKNNNTTSIKYILTTIIFFCSVLFVNTMIKRYYFNQSKNDYLLLNNSSLTS